VFNWGEEQPSYLYKKKIGAEETDQGGTLNSTQVPLTKKKPEDLWEEGKKKAKESR